MLGLALGLGLGFDPSTPIVRELVLSLTRLFFPLVRFGRNPQFLANSPPSCLKIKATATVAKEMKYAQVGISNFADVEISSPVL